ncbi:MAG TPA: TlpA disulfide reductase family protein [Candidatus Limnocylindrales bacterium]|nr:TlpA disulfide reductase family protein [Candidatus Limnocylindrales bacterium]
MGPAPDRRPVVIGLLVAFAVTAAVVAFVALTRPGGEADAIARDEPAPTFDGMTLEGETFSLAEMRGRPVIVNFWGPTCVPCRDEFPLFKAKLAEHEADGVVLVGVLMADPPDLARQFVAEQAAGWPTVVDPDGAIKAAYRVVARPQTYFIDGNGILRGIQIGEVRESDFERHYALIAGRS